MLGIIQKQVFRVGLGTRRYATKTLTNVKVQKQDVGIPDSNNLLQQAPNRIIPWSRSQTPRSEAMVGPRFEGRDLEKQPRPYSAMELIAKEPVRYIEDDNIAVCDGNTNAQGHPKIFINLDPPSAHSCGYCGLRFAKLEYKDLIEGKEEEV
ncbi:hypothetical protein PACTADRAFT_32095 [Pachysolen tannophilus NRRL Y-2460]|uniref:Zinc finger CHCC-type domain-containing protein n=1 Tax=Pachysolen tannophilus NRRL Y-2460 TaxID=669874 RepID=A0A1E4TXZ9_PACTA|nr:hypothetical protein PACTADRAFT_32095 [Pachysolen tannophilus NRRL Y-2460]